MFPSHIFKAYDIRGLVEEDLSDELAYGIGRAFVQVLRAKGMLNSVQNDKPQKLVVGKDMRETSPQFAKEVIRAINDEGVDVVDIGLTSTPVFNLTCADNDTVVGGIMVTASHNPSEYNGFKLTMGDGLPIGKATCMSDIRDMVEAGDFVNSTEEKGRVEEYDAITPYIEKIFSLVDITKIKPLKIVVDGGNGMGGVVLPQVLEKLPIQVAYLYMEPDGTFPNHEANPLKTETLKDLQEKVKGVGADFGFALDGDADRIGLVDEHGDVVEASFVGALLGLEVLKKHTGAHMLYDLRSSHIVRDVWEEKGATTEKCMVGHALIKKMMQEVDAVFASELSLHIFFGDLYNLESSDLCLLYFLYLVSVEGKTISELVAPLKKYYHSGEINFEVENKEAVLKRLEETYMDEAHEVSHLDGLWMDFDWGWVSVRQSNTEPVLRLNVEVYEESDLDEKIREFRDIIQR